MKKVLKFHTSRGGRFHNSGYVTFVGFENIEEGYSLQDMFLTDGKWFEANGNELDCQLNEDGTGYIDIDGGYDSTHCVSEDDLSDKQKEALARYTDSNVFVEMHNIYPILKEYYPEYIEDEKDWQF